MENDKQIVEECIFRPVPLELIDTEGQSVRDSQDDDHVVELSMSIAKHGLLEPIVLEEKEDGRYQLQAGFHRLAAFHRLGRTRIPANIRQKHTAPVKGIALVENICRKDMSLEEQVKAIEYLNHEENLSPSQICDLVGKSRAWVDSRLTIRNYAPEVLEELFDGHITIKVAELVSRIQDEPTRKLLLNQIIQCKFTNRQAEDLVVLYLETPSIPSAVEEGYKKAQEVQAAQTTYRKCYVCGELRPLADILFVPVCIEGIDKCSQTVDEILVKEVTDNGSKPGVVQNGTDNKDPG